MSSDPNKKTGRTFQCRDALWDTFQQMAQELECSVDYLINESMKQYARQRYAGRAAGTTTGNISTRSEGSSPPASGPTGSARRGPRPLGVGPVAPPMHPPLRSSLPPAPAAAAGHPLPPPPARKPTLPPPPGRPAGGPGGGGLGLA